MHKDISAIPFPLLKLYFLLLIGSLSLSAGAQNDNVSFHQDAQIAALTELYKTYNSRNDVADGFRIQVAFSNDRQEAYDNKSKVYRDLPGDKCYVEYEEPYYKLRIGDFATRLEAYDELRNVITKFPGAFVVAAKVKIK